MQNWLTNFRLPEAISIPTSDAFIDLAKRAKAAGHKAYTDGRSINGKSVTCFVIGSGQDVIGVTAGAHSDEPTGSATAYHLIDNLISNPDFASLLERVSFVIFPMLDPDGAELNYSWTKDSNFDFGSYLLHNYRNNNPANDCEHGIPVLESQKARPELAFFKSHIDMFSGRIRYYVTLHTTHVLGGAVFVTRPDFNDKPFIKRIQDLCSSFNLPMMDYQPRGEDGITYIDRGFLGAPYMSAYQEKYKSHPEILAMLKMTTYEYVETKCGADITMISELPIWIDERFADTSDVEQTVAGIKAAKLASAKANLPRIKNSVSELESLGADTSNPWMNNAKFANKMLERTLQDQESDLEKYSGLKATQADLVDLEKLPFEEDLKIHRLYLKALPEGTAYKETRRYHHAKFDEALERLKSVSQLKLLDLRTQVQIQAGMIFQDLEL